MGERESLRKEFKLGIKGNILAMDYTKDNYSIKIRFQINGKRNVARDLVNTLHCNGLDDLIITCGRAEIPGPDYDRLNLWEEAYLLSLV